MRGLKLYSDALIRADPSRCPHGPRGIHAALTQANTLATRRRRPASNNIRQRHTTEQTPRRSRINAAREKKARRATTHTTWTTKRRGRSGLNFCTHTYRQTIDADGEGACRAPHDGRDVDQSHAAWVTDYRRIVGVNGKWASGTFNQPTKRGDRTGKGSLYSVRAVFNDDIGDYYEW